MQLLTIILLLPSLASAALRCPDGTECQDESTCCKLRAGRYGCCPMEEVGFSIITESKTPVMKSEALSSSGSSNSSTVQCDHQYYCPYNDICCREMSGLWSCCSAQSVCCYSGTQCCPKNNMDRITASSPPLTYPSEPIEGKLLQGTEIQSNIISNDATIIHCDSMHFCPSGQTCCRLPNGNWGCCPHPEANCCKDGLHCCPRGTRCDTISSKCLMDNIGIPWITKKPAMTVSEAQQDCSSNDCPVVKCDDTHVCKAGSTCCKMYNKQWGCCPFRNAHCCWDGKHCCPSYHWCDNKNNRCRRWFHSDNWSQMSSVKYGK